MRMYDLIEKKKHGQELSREEIAYMIRGFVDGQVPDYQMAAILMAIYFRGMTDRETAELTIDKVVDLLAGGMTEGFTSDAISACAAKIRSHTRA